MLKSLLIPIAILLAGFMIAIAIFQIKIEQCGEDVSQLRYKVYKAETQIDWLACEIGCLDEIDTYKCQERCKAGLE